MAVTYEPCGSLTVHGRPYRVEYAQPPPELAHLDRAGHYRLTGPRGAEYFTVRYINAPNHFFLVSWKGHALRKNPLGPVVLTDGGQPGPGRLTVERGWDQ